MSDYGVRRKFEVKNIDRFWAYESGVKFKHQNNMDEFDFPIETLKKMLEVYESAQHSVQRTAATPRKTGTKSKAVKAVKSRRR